MSERAFWLAAAGLLAALLAFALIRAIVAAPPSVAVEVRDESFLLPAKLRPDSEQLVASLSRVDLWGMGTEAYLRKQPQAAPAASADRPRSWRLTGTYARGSDAYVLISFDGKAAEPLKVGDGLPGGARIVEIRQDQICILINGKKRALEVRTR